MVYGAAAHRALRHRRRSARPGCPAWSRGDTMLTAAMAELVGEVIVPGGTEPATTATAAGGRLLGARRAPRPACRPALVADAVLVPATLPGAGRRRPPGLGVFIVETARRGARPARRRRRPRDGPRRSWTSTGVRGRGRPASWASGRRRRRGHRPPSPSTPPPRCASRRPACAPRPSSSPPSTPRPACSSTSPSPPSRPSASGPPTPTSTPRRSGSRRGRRRRAWPPGCRPPPRWPWPSTGRPRAASGWCTPPPTSTAAWASTATTRCTATSCSPSQIELTLGGANESLRRLGRILADEPGLSRPAGRTGADAVSSGGAGQAQAVAGEEDARLVVARVRARPAGGRRGSGRGGSGAPPRGPGPSRAPIRAPHAVGGRGGSHPSSRSTSPSGRVWLVTQRTEIGRAPTR